MKILSANEMRAADDAAIKRIGIPGRVLMENAGREVAHVVFLRGAHLLERGVVVIAGRGNNGGDGYVTARVLGSLGIPCDVLSTCPLKELEGDARENARAWAELGGSIVETTPQVWTQNDFEAKLRQSGVIIDALYGSGFRGEISGFEAQIVERINQITKNGQPLLVSVDLPSGLSADGGLVSGVAFRAHYTVALQCLKLCHVNYPAAEYCGDVIVADIGIPESLPEIASISCALASEDIARGVISSAFKANPASHKGTRGHVVVFGGSPGQLGAPKMAGYAALKCGAGLGTLVLPATAAKAVSAEVHELMCVALADNPEGGSLQGPPGHFAESIDSQAVAGILNGKDAVVIGPGLGQGLGARDLLREVIQLAGNKPLVIDADAINILAANPELQEMLSPNAVLTPHPGEMSRLCGVSVESIQSQRAEIAREWAAHLKCTVVLKGAQTVIAAPDGGVMINPAATEALATGGSGDVLSGIIAAALARGLASFDAAVVGVYVHGRAGERAARERQGVTGVLAMEIADMAGIVVNELTLRSAAHAIAETRALPGSPLLVFSRK